MYKSSNRLIAVAKLVRNKAVQRRVRGNVVRGARVRGGVRRAAAADAPRWWAATAARRARRAPRCRGMSSAPARPGPCARHGAGRARVTPRSHTFVREEDFPQAYLLPSLLRPAVGPHRAGLRLRRYAHAPHARRYAPVAGSARDQRPPARALPPPAGYATAPPHAGATTARPVRPGATAASRPGPTRCTPLHLAPSNRSLQMLCLKIPLP
ncbi:hypothetical protein EVAR_32040_1 [Eumeta japonica]|uniref:Uncharacterized protein n=1 Tax=Eumeta variegata TaxID=151549 RepID=A0A4C1WQU1_EUMVA|nr:hypothetical protein EVAR_32040_1 [Eumeta japonica]